MGNSARVRTEVEECNEKAACFPVEVVTLMNIPLSHRSTDGCTRATKTVNVSDSGRHVRETNEDHEMHSRWLERRELWPELRAHTRGMTSVEQDIMVCILTFSHPDCTVGFGITPNPIFQRRIDVAERLAGLACIIRIQTTPPVGNFTLPRRSL